MSWEYSTHVMGIEDQYHVIVSYEVNAFLGTFEGGSRVAVKMGSVGSVEKGNWPEG